MNDLPIRFKLMMLAGVPVLGALSLSFVIVTTATEQVRKADWKITLFSLLCR